MKQIVIVHPEMGIYLGNSMGLAYWSLMDTAGQYRAAAIASERQAREHIAAWEPPQDADSFRYVLVETTDENFATYQELFAAGLDREAAPMLANVPLGTKQ